MHTIINTSRILNFAFAALFVVILSPNFVSTAQAAGDEWTPDVLYAPAGDYGAFSDSPDYGAFSGSGDYAYMSGDYGYSGYGYSGGYSGGFSGGWYLGGGYGGYGGTGYSTASTNINTCTATNSCNTTYDDHSVYTYNSSTNVSNGSGGYAYSYPVYIPSYTPTYTPSCNYCGCPGYTPCYNTVNNTPYVTLAAVPYTGLELGPVGTALYWGFLVLWALGAAYLIAVKKVQNKIVAWFQPKADQPRARTDSRLVQKAAYTAPDMQAVEPGSNIDPFIASQISRA